MKKKTGNNSVQFLLDGNRFFTELGVLLDDLLESGPENSYLRMAYWQFSPDTILPENPSTGRPQVRLIDMLAELALNGVEIQLIAWAGTRIANSVTPEMKSSWRMKRWVDKFNDKNNDSLGFRIIGLYMEPYGKSLNIGTSNHQKITIVKIKNQRACLVGGENLSKTYLSSTEHNPVNWWHDTAVRVRGPITEFIDAEFVRRWNKKSTHNVPAPTALEGESEVGDTSITLLTTNIETSPAQRDIKEQVLRRITDTNVGGAIYMENYAMTDPDIVSALSRLVTEHPTVDLVVLVNHPQNEVIPGFSTFSYLMYYTYASLELPVLETVSVWESYLNYKLGRETIYAADSIDDLAVEVPNMCSQNLAKFNPATGYRFSFKVGEKSHSYDFSYIADIKPISSFMYSPILVQPTKPNQWPYPHSKLAIFNNRYTMIGTSNWTYRSMQYDGEITLEVDCPDFAQEVQEQLFEHWNQEADIAEWSDRAMHNLESIHNGEAPLGQLKIVPLTYEDFINPNSNEWNSLAATTGWLASAYF